MKKNTTMTEIDYSKTLMTVGYLVKNKKVLLVEKGRNIGAGKLTGVGGKQEDGETLDQTQIRETEEEIKVKVTKMRKAAEIEFIFPYNPKYGGNVTGYIIEEWKGEPQTTPEAKSVDWYGFDNLPENRMWHDNTIWVPRILSGKKVKGKFTIGPDDRVTEYTLTEVESF